MKLHHLLVFVTVVERGGVVAAAQHLHVSQPAASAALRALEDELGEPLFHRPGGGRRLVPTAKALRFHGRATEILGQCEAARAEFRADGGNKLPRLRLGVLPTIAGRDVVAVTAALARGEPGWSLHLREADRADLADRLRRGRLEAAWTTVEEDAANARVLWREDFVALVALGHRLARHRSSGVGVRDLDGERIVLRAACELRGGQLRAAGIALRAAARAARDELALRLVAAGVGIAIAPGSLATEEVVAVPVADLGLRRSIGLVWRSDAPAHLIAAVLDAVAEQAYAVGRSDSAGMRPPL